MSDRPDESRSTSEVAGGWFVPKSAMTEEEITAASPPEANGVTMPDNTTPEKSGQWYVPPGAEARAAALSTSPSSDPVTPDLSAPVTDQKTADGVQTGQ